MASDRHGYIAGAVEGAKSPRSGFSWEALLQDVPAAFYVDRTDGTSLWASVNLETIFGCTQEEWASGYEAWLERIHPDDRTEAWDAFVEFIDTGGPQSSEYRVVLPDGRVRWIHDHALLVSDPASGEPLIHGVLVDVTDQRAARAGEERVSRLFRALIEHTREAVTIVDANGVIMFHNPSMGRVIGRPPEWFEGKTPLDLMPPEDAARGREILARLLTRPGAQLPGEFRLRHRDGSLRTVEGVATNLLHDSAVRGIVLNYRDVTDERTNQQRRQSQTDAIINAEAEQRSRIAEELHDDTIQVMIASLFELDRAERHLQDGDIDATRRTIADARKALHVATERTRRLTFELRPQLLEAAGLGPAIHDIANALARDSGAEVTVDAQLPRYSAAVETLAYRTTREALINIRKHAHAKHVDINAVERDGALDVVIHDDGCGFATRQRSSRISHHIGVESARKRIQAAGGHFELRSQPNRGTTVAFRLPIKG
jgi:PAS domain S-box-containing protein